MRRMEAHESHPEIIREREDPIDLLLRHLPLRCSDTLDMQIMPGHEGIKVCLIECVKK